MAINSPSEKAIIAVTGSRGFIGSELIPLLEEKNIACITFEGDLLDFESVRNFFKTNPAKQVIHLAGSFNGGFEQLLRKNVIITHHLLEAGAEFGLEKIIYASTGAVYGEPAGKSSLESDACKPNTLYGLSKKMAEDVIFCYHLVKGLKYVILRFPNVYGEGNQKGVLYNFLKAIHTKGSITIAGDGSQSRNFLHVSDACNAIIKSVDYNENNIFNISNPVKTSIKELVTILKQYHSFDINYKDADNFLRDLLLDTSKAEKILGFKAAFGDLSSYIKSFNYSETQ